MSDRDDRWNLPRLRETLVLGTSGADFQTAGVTLRVSDAPLFKEVDGHLHQAIRLWVRSDSVPQQASFSVHAGDTELDSATSLIGPDPQSIYLLVPEIHTPATFQLQVTDHVAEPFHAEVEVKPQRKWNIFLIHHSHLDIGYTDPQATVLEHQLAYIDAALDLITATDAWPEPARFRWNVETTWPLKHWLRTRPAATRNAFLQRVMQGRIEVNALPFSMHTEAYSIDELARQLWFTDELRETYGLNIVSAMQTDVPGATIGLATLLTDAGIRYLAVAHNYAGRSVPHLVGGQNLTRPFYWQAPNGDRLLVWYTDTPHGVAYMEGNLAGLAVDYETALASFPEYLNALAQRPYPYGSEAFGWSGVPPGVEVAKQPYPHDILHLRVQSVIADNAAPSLAPAAIVHEWNDNWAYPHLRMATNREFFSAAEERLGDKLDTYSGDWTDWWADGIGSAARQLGFNREAQSDIRAAQTLHTLADVTTEDPQPSVADDVNQVYDDMALFDEHTWGAANPWEDGLSEMSSGGLQWSTKAAFAHSARDRSKELVNTGLLRVAHLGHASEALASILVFNATSWSRTDLVRVFIPESQVGGESRLTIVDPESQASVPHVMEDQSHSFYRARGRYASFIAQAIPPFGYARYDIVASGEPIAAGQATPGTSTSEQAAIENNALSLDFDPLAGHIARLTDKVASRELIDTNAPYGFNQYVYDRYTSAPGFNHLSSRITAVDLALLGSRTTGGYGIVTSRASNPVWERLTVRMNGEGADWIETTLTLPHGLPRLDITNRLHKVSTPQKESVFFAFPFNAPTPSLSFEITGAIAGPDDPTVPGAAHYFRAIRHWVGIESTSAPPIAWATKEAPLIQLGNIHLPYAPFPETIAPNRANPATIYSWGLNNIWDTNFPPQQGGELRFRYAVATGGDTGVNELGARTAAALTSPLLGICSNLSGDREMALPPRGSFCAIDQPQVEITHLAPSRRGHDLVIFLQSTASEPVDAHVTFGLLPVTKAWSGDFLERNLIPITIDSGSSQITIEPGAYTLLALDLKQTR